MLLKSKILTAKRLIMVTDAPSEQRVTIKGYVLLLFLRSKNNKSTYPLHGKQKKHVSLDCHVRSIWLTMIHLTLALLFETKYPCLLKPKILKAYCSFQIEDLNKPCLLKSCKDFNKQVALFLVLSKIWILLFFFNLVF